MANLRQKEESRGRVEQAQDVQMTQLKLRRKVRLQLNLQKQRIYFDQNLDVFLKQQNVRRWQRRVDQKHNYHRCSVTVTHVFGPQFGLGSGKHCDLTSSFAQLQ